MSLSDIKRRPGNSDDGNNSNSDGVDLLAERVAKVVRCNPPHVFSQSSTISPEILEKCFTFPVTKTNL